MHSNMRAFVLLMVGTVLTIPLEQNHSVCSPLSRRSRYIGGTRAYYRHALVDLSIDRDHWSNNDKHIY